MAKTWSIDVNCKIEMNEKWTKNGQKVDKNGPKGTRMDQKGAKGDPKGSKFSKNVSQPKSVENHKKQLRFGVVPEALGRDLGPPGPLRR